MSKQIKIKVKDINKLEFELLEDAHEGDFISLNEINKIDLTEIKDILESKKNEYYKPFKEEEKHQIELNAINNFIASNDYQTLLNKLKNSDIQNVRLQEKLNNSVIEYKNSKEYQDLIDEINNYKQNNIKLQEQLINKGSEEVNKFKESEEYKNLLNQLETAKINEKILSQKINDAVLKFKASKDYLDIIEKLNDYELDNTKLKEQLKIQSDNIISQYKNSDEFKNLLLLNKQIDELKIKHSEELKNAVLIFKNSEEFKTLQDAKNYIPILKQQIENEKEKLLQEQKNNLEKISDINNQHKLQLENNLLVQKPKIIEDYKKSEEYQSLIADKKNLENEVANLKFSQRTKNTKNIGEELERWIIDKYNDTFSMAFGDVIFEKANFSIEGTKPDFLFEVINSSFNKEDPEYITGKVVIEAKTEFTDAQYHKKNSDHFKKLDSDKKKNNADYAILVTTLEPEADFGIYLAPGYDDMFVVRPEWLMSLLSLIRKIFLKKQKIQQLNIEFKNKLEIKKMFDDFRNNLLENSFKNIKNKLENIEKLAQAIIKNANSILEEREIIISKHINTMKNKIEDFKIEKVERKINKLLLSDNSMDEDISSNNPLLENK